MICIERFLNDGKDILGMDRNITFFQYSHSFLKLTLSDLTILAIDLALFSYLMNSEDYTTLLIRVSLPNRRQKLRSRFFDDLET